MQWSHWFAGMMDVQHGDRLYDALPMYHSIGGVSAVGALLVGGGSVVIRERFSAGEFWNDVVRWDCTIFQYIGELCRYLLHSPPSPEETRHRLRMCCGNGLRRDLWDAFRMRFRIAHIFEFYAATEGMLSLFNIEGKAGAIGRIPPVLAHRIAVALVRFDVEKGEPVRDGQGRCVRCASGETGEAIARIDPDPQNVSARFEGYTSDEESQQKIIRGVFEPGDAWFRTGDLMRQDGEGYFYFVDRIGDTFRWKGENVATSEVSDAIRAFPGVRDAETYGVEIPGTDGRAGMACLVADRDLDLASLRAHLVARLPGYARPLFLRFRKELAVTSTFKHAKRELMSEGYDPSLTTDPIYFDDRESGSWVRLDPQLFDRINAGQCRL
jgi:fatty-acyl-CoA synthase